MLYESCGCSRGALGALLASRSCFPGVLRLSPVSAISAAMRKAQKHAIPVRICSPRAGSGTVSSGKPWSSGLWRSEPKATQTDPRAPTKLPRKSLSGDAWEEWRHTVNPADSSAAELLSEHCFAGKCSTSYVLDSGDPWERSWLAGAASQASCAPAR